MEDYIQIMEDLLDQYFSPTGTQNLVQMETKAVLFWFRGVIPPNPIDEHDVYAVLKQKGFKQSQKVTYEKTCIFEGDEEKGIPPEYDNEEVNRYLVWDLYEK